MPEERWLHIREEHGELAGRRTEVLNTVNTPQRILAGSQGEKLAVREIATGKFLVQLGVNTTTEIRLLYLWQ
jgi:hypothetical protein